jgi:hypothetical protein
MAKTNEDGTPKTSIPRGVARVLYVNGRDMPKAIAKAAKRKLKGK